MRRLRGASLVEAIVAAVVFLLVFAAVLEILPRLTVRGDDTLLLVEADYRMKRAFAKYATGVWPCGEYGEEYGWGRVVVKLNPYRDFPDLQVVEVKVFINGSEKRLGVTQIIAFEE